MNAIRVSLSTDKEAVLGFNTIINLSLQAESILVIIYIYHRFDRNALIMKRIS